MGDRVRIDWKFRSGKDRAGREQRLKPVSGRVLVIRFGPLGDFALSLGAFAAIRRHHPDSPVVLLTPEPFRDLAEASGSFDEVWTGGEPPTRSALEVLRLARRLRRGGFARVYDLQASRRTALYRLLLGRRRPEWFGSGRAAVDRNRTPRHTSLPIRLADQLCHAGITAVPEPDVSWIDADVARFDLPVPFALLVPGGGKRVPHRWPADRYNALAKALAERGLTPVVLGCGPKEKLLAGQILRECPGGLDLTDRTSLLDLVALGRAASVAIGNDTGPIYLIGLSGAQTVVLLPSSSVTDASAPRGPRVEMLDARRLRTLSLTRVLQAVPPVRKRETLP